MRLDCGTSLSFQSTCWRPARSSGEFDYIIAHGVYSWVPENARERLLHICRANLAPHGMAYVSYNAYPGFHRREMFREMILYRLESVKDAGEHRPRAIEFIDWLGRCGTQNPFMRALVAEELRHLTESEWWYVCHDDLAADNHAEYFHEFVDRVRGHGLEYLGEADFFEMQDDIYAEPVAEAIERFAQGDVIRKEQYLDFIKGRAFRQTLLCRKEVELTRLPRPEQITSLHVSSDANPISAAPNLGPGVAEEFRNSRGGRLRTEDCQVKRALVRLSSAWPQSIAFPELQAEVGDESAPLTAALFQAYRAGVIEARISPDRFITRAGERPMASPIARLQAQDGSLVTTLRHTTAELTDDADRHLVRLLDGTRDRPMLLEALRTVLAHASEFSRGPGHAGVAGDAPHPVGEAGTAHGLRPAAMTACRTEPCRRQSR